MNTKLTFLVLAGLLLITIPAFTQDHSGIEKLGEISFWSGANDVDVDDDLAFVTTGKTGIKVFDISDPEHVSQVNTYTGEGTDASNLKYYNGNLILWGGDCDGLKIIDVSDIENPRLRYESEWRNTVNYIEIDNDIMYLNRNWDFITIDISDIDQPEIIGEPEFRYDVFKIRGNYACAIRWSDKRLVILDVSNPRNIEIITSIGVQSFEGGFCLSGDYIFMSCLARGVRGICGVDISNPQDPELICEYSFHDLPDFLVACDDILYAVCDDQGIGVIDISNPAEPDLERFIEMEPGLNSVTRFGNTLQATSYNTGYMYFSVNDPHNPRLIDSFGICDNFRCIDVHNELVCLGGDFLNIVDCEDPENPRLVSRWNEYTPVRDIQIRDTIAYLAADGLTLVNLANRAEPECLAIRGLLGGNRMSLDINDGYAYLGLDFSWGTDGLYIADISNPANPRDYCYITRFDNPSDICWYSGEIYVLSRNLLSVNRIRGKRDYVVPSFIQLPASGLGLTVEYRRAIVSDGEEGVLIIDVSNPENIREICRIETGSNENRSAIFGDYVLTASGANGLRVYNTEDPEAPEEVGFFETAGKAVDIVFDNYLVYLIEEQRFSVYDCSECMDYDAAPIWIEYPVDTLLFYSGDCVYLELQAKDPNPEDSYRFGFRGEIADSVSLIPLGNGRCCFEWFTREDEQGVHDLTFTVMDGRNTDSIDVFVELVNVNFRPTFADKPPAEIEVTTGETVEFTLSAFDPNGDSLSFSIDYHRLPDWVEFRDNHDGTAHFRWDTEVEDRGIYQPSFFVSDGEGSDTCTTMIVVNPLTVDSKNSELPVSFRVYSPHPNPFNNQSTVTIDMPGPGSVKTGLMDIHGRRTVGEEACYSSAGSYSYLIRGEGLPAGIYFLEVRTDYGNAVTKVVLLR